MKTKTNVKPIKIKSIEEVILHDEKDFFIINKPPFISTLEDRNDPVNVLSLAKDFCSDARVCHRLDKETSGILIIAKNEGTYKYFSYLFEQREVKKLYHAIVEGKHEIDEKIIEKPIYSSTSKSRIDFQMGKPSLTMVSTIDIFKAHTLLACMPFTGRLHQIRVHLADQGLSICGDEIYGGKPIFLSQIKRNFTIGKGKEETPLMHRVSLHAAGIAFPLTDGTEFKIKAPYPKDFQVTLKQLEKNRL